MDPVNKLGTPTRVSGIRLANTLMNGAYIHSKTLADVETLVKSAAGAVVVGSILISPRDKNPGQGYWLHRERFFSLNSFGLPNGGILYFKKHLPKMVKIAHDHGKPLIANVVGFSNDEFVRLVGLAEEAGADMAELNLGCPNIWDGGKQERILSYHPGLVRSTLQAIGARHPNIKVSVKISPLPPDTLREVCRVIADSGIVHAVTATNSYPNTAVTSGAQGPDRSNVLVGLAGNALHPISVGVVRQSRALLPRHIDIIGVGGVNSARDAADYLSAGAKAVQIASALTSDGPSVFDKILFQASHG